MKIKPALFVSFAAGKDSRLLEIRCCAGSFRTEIRGFPIRKRLGPGAIPLLRHLLRRQPLLLHLQSHLRLRVLLLPLPRPSLLSELLQV